MLNRKGLVVLIEHQQVGWRLMKVQSGTYHSAASVCFGTVRTVWAAKKIHPKKFLQLFPYIFHIKTKWNIVYKYLKTEIFSRDTSILPQMHGISKYFWTLSYCHWGFWVSLSYPILNLKKTVCPKDIWMQHCTKTQKDLKLSEATYSNEETNWSNLQGPEATYIKQEATRNNL